jgi:hypothetical protein
MIGEKFDGSCLARPSTTKSQFIEVFYTHRLKVNKLIILTHKMSLICLQSELYERQVKKSPRIIENHRGYMSFIA